MSGIAERLAEVVEAIIVDHDMWIGDKGEPLEYLPEREARIAAFVDEVAQALLPVVEREIAAAEQRGREDNADHGMCYVSGSKALEAKIAAARETGWVDGYEKGLLEPGSAWMKARAEDLAAAWDEGYTAADFAVHRGIVNPCAVMDRGNPYRAALSPDPDRGEGEA